MKIIKNISLSVAGFFTMLTLWLIGSFSYDYWFNSFEHFLEFLLIIPMIIACAMPVLLLIFAIIGKRFNLKALYISSAVGMALPLIAYITSVIFSDDGNILTWIYAFTFGLILMPFGRMAFNLLDGVDSFFFVFLDRWFERDLFVGGMLAIVILSVIIFLLVRTRNKKSQPTDFIQE